MPRPNKPTKILKKRPNEWPNTIVSKYEENKQPVYTIFVGFRKTFDLVHRALFYKFAKQWVTGPGIYLTSFKANEHWTPILIVK